MCDSAGRRQRGLEAQVAGLMAYCRPILNDGNAKGLKRAEVTKQDRLPSDVTSRKLLRIRSSHSGRVGTPFLLCNPLLCRSATRRRRADVSTHEQHA